MKWFFVVINWFVASLLLFSYLSSFIHPSYFWPFSFFGLLFPLFFILNVIFLAIWLVKRKKIFWISLLAILIGWPKISSYYNIGTHKLMENDSDSILYKTKLLSYNVRLFDLYNWKNDQNMVTRNKIFQYIKKENADLLMLQEFFVDDSKKFNTLDSIVQFQPAKYFHVEYTSSLNEIYHWGIATFSKYPIVNKGKVDFVSQGNNICIYTDLLIGSDTVRIYNMHLASIHFQYEEYELLQEIGKINPFSKSTHSRDSSGPIRSKNRVKKLGDTDIKIVSVLKEMVKRIKTAFIIRANQADLIAKHIINCRFPVIVCGDFNDTPMSYSYQKISQGLVDAFHESGTGFGNTFVGPLPYFRIDFILHDPIFKSFDFHTNNSVTLSDHYPLTLDFVK